MTIAKQTNFAKIDFCHRNICSSLIGDILHLEILQYITSHGRASTPAPPYPYLVTPFPFSALHPLIPSHHHPAVRKVSISLICTPAEKIGAACSASVRKQKHKNRWFTCRAFYRDYAGIGFIFFSTCFPWIFTFVYTSPLKLQNSPIGTKKILYCLCFRQAQKQ